MARGIKHFDETEAKYGHSQTFFPIVQGCIYRDLREKSAEFIASQNREGNAIGGFVGEPTEKMYEMIELVNAILPKKPRYLMGVGTPANILEGHRTWHRHVRLRNAHAKRKKRNVIYKNGIMNMRNKNGQMIFSHIDPDGASDVDILYSKSLFTSFIYCQRTFSITNCFIHNLAFYLWLVKEARKHIISGDFSSWKPNMIKQISQRL